MRLRKFVSGYFDQLYPLDFARTLRSVSSDKAAAKEVKKTERMQNEPTSSDEIRNSVLSFPELLSTRFPSTETSSAHQGRLSKQKHASSTAFTRLARPNLPSSSTFPLPLSSLDSRDSDGVSTWTVKQWKPLSANTYPRSESSSFLAGYLFLHNLESSRLALPHVAYR